ncbi:hypothetical protein KL86PLE_90644 [uncultured Pleomorphomonas sp.]|uniref:Uncharacterized protein n=1 Tax=uncultured Pleomorphomonas sp. TaxID=442121 RepID=A0A212LQL4_9HYPH|nr:hypothetical protein KL86PLE_90644 [uncultured Pleomorphomonas sp.]
MDAAFLSHLLYVLKGHKSLPGDHLTVQPPLLDFSAEAAQRHAAGWEGDLQRIFEA